MTISNIYNNLRNTFFSPPKDYLSALPPELMEEVTKTLSATDIANLAKTSRSLKNIDNERVWGNLSIRDLHQSCVTDPLDRININHCVTLYGKSFISIFTDRL